MHDILTRVTPPPPRRLCVLLLAAGLVVGSLAGPAFLGRVAPDVYQRLWVGGVAEQAALNRHLQDAREAVADLHAVDVSEIALDERLAQAAATEQRLRDALATARAERAATLDGVRGAVMLAVVAAAILTVLGLGRWTYLALSATIAAWLLLALATPW